MLPDRGWQSYEAALRRVGERRTPSAGDDTLRAFLARLGLLHEDRHSLTHDGQAYFDAAFIKADQVAADEILHRRVLDFPPATAVAQILTGVQGADRQRAETVLRSQNVEGVTDRRVGSLLSLMNRAGVVAYNPKTGGVQVKASPITSQTDTVPASVFVSPATPFGNRVWLRRVLEECEGHIDWLDKHFVPVALEALWEAVDGNRVRRVRILSLALPEHDGKRPLKAYRDLRAELVGRGVELSWRRIDNAKIRGTHDRWIIGAQSARNVPNVNAIYSGQHSELNLSAQRAELQPIFESYWSVSNPFDGAEDHPVRTTPNR